MSDAPLYADKSAGELALNLVEGTVDVEQFTVLRRGTLRASALTVECGIIGASHFVRVHREHDCFTEVFACAEVETRDRKLYCGSIRDQLRGAVYLSVFGKYQYAFSFRVVSWEKGQGQYKKQSLHARIAGEEDASRIGLWFDFPMLPEILPQDVTVQQPRTTLFGAITRNGLSVETMHSYPNEGVLVFTRTSVTLT